MTPESIATKADLAAMEQRLAAILTKATAAPVSVWVTRKEAAQIMGCSLDTVDKWRKANPTQCKRVGGVVLLRREAIEG